MSIKDHVTFAELATGGTPPAFSPQWSKTVEADRLLTAIYDESLAPDSTATATRAARFVGLTTYLNAKWGMASAEYKALGGPARQAIRDLTLNNTLVDEGEIAIGRCGRFHRVMTSVYNETVGHTGKEADYQTWCAGAINNIATQLGITPPTGPVVPTTVSTTQGGFDHPHSDHH
jgi:hypothetical protein